MADYWRWYVGTLDQELFDWFAGQRPARKTGIVSNSGPGAREAERCWGFEEITDDIVYSHEVGLRKPDPRIFVLAAERLGVRPDEIVFLDDVAGPCRGGPRGGVPGRRAPFDPRVHRRDRGRDRGRAAAVKDLPEGPLRLGPVLRYVDADHRDRLGRDPDGGRGGRRGGRRHRARRHLRRARPPLRAGRGHRPAAGHADAVPRATSTARSSGRRTIPTWPSSRHR